MPGRATAHHEVHARSDDDPALARTRPWPTMHDLTSLRTVMYGAAPMYVERLKEALDRFGPVFVGVFAQGEAPLACTWLAKEEHVATDEASQRRLASVGSRVLRRPGSYRGSGRPGRRAEHDWARSSFGATW